MDKSGDDKLSHIGLDRGSQGVGRRRRGGRRVHWILGLTLIAWLGPQVGAVEVAPGEEYGAGTKVEFLPFGLVLTVPEGWHGHLVGPSEMFLLTSDDGPSTIHLYSEPLSERRLMQFLAAPRLIDTQFDLTPSAPPRQEDGLWIADYRATPRPEESARIVARIGYTHMTSELIESGGDTTREQTYRTAEQVIRQLTFLPPFGH